ncbi:MAG TPA: RidA family protein [Gemmatimonadaceae bacterium]|jgi:lysine/arginine/ornithine transport system substrate-binding protein
MLRSTPSLLAVASFIALTGCMSAKTSGSASPTAPRPQFVVPRQGTSPFSGVVRVGDLLFVAGQLGTDSNGLVKGGIGPETTAAMNNIDRLLTQAGSSMDRVAKCTVMLADMSQWTAMNDAYMKFFPTNPPARSSFGATALAMGGHVEIECIAAAG